MRASFDLFLSHVINMIMSSAVDGKFSRWPANLYMSPHLPAESFYLSALREILLDISAKLRPRLGAVLADTIILL